MAIVMKHVVNSCQGNAVLVIKLTVKGILRAVATSPTRRSV